MLRLLYLLVVAILTVACAGVTGPGRGLASRPAPIEHVVACSTNAVLNASELQPSQEWREGAERPVVCREVVEAGVDDDDERDARSEFADDPAMAFRDVWIPREPGRALRGEPQSTTSRFAIRRGFPRGPPA